LTKPTPLILYQAIEECGYFLINAQYNWLVISTDLKENAALHCLVACFLHLQRPTLTLNIKSKAQQKKLKTIRGSYTGLDLSIHDKKTTLKIWSDTPFKITYNHLITSQDLTFQYFLT
jgi:hypothetical protein